VLQQCFCIDISRATEAHTQDPCCLSGST